MRASWPHALFCGISLIICFLLGGSKDFTLYVVIDIHIFILWKSFNAFYILRNMAPVFFSGSCSSDAWQSGQEAQMACLPLCTCSEMWLACCVSFWTRSSVWTEGKERVLHEGDSHSALEACGRKHGCWACVEVLSKHLGKVGPGSSGLSQ